MTNDPQRQPYDSLLEEDPDIQERVAKAKLA